MRAGIALLCLMACAPLEAADFLAAPKTDQLIIKFKQNGAESLPSPAERQILSFSQLRRLSALAGIYLAPHRVSDYGQIVKLPKKMVLSDAVEVTRKLSASPDVLYAEPDKMLFPSVIPNDSEYSRQWNLHSSVTDIGGINLPGAWDVTTGTLSVVVAVIDSGVLAHTDLIGRLLPGYDFVSDISKANDGDGRDSDPTDPGDWVTAEEAGAGPFAGCSVSNSTWHGTHVAGTIGAVSNNGAGITGISWGGRILPVRGMGKCGGYVSDITDGMRWAAGLPVTGVPNNANPARILNLSLGGDGPCSITEQLAIDAVVSAGAIVVVAAGNESQNATNVSPANCNNVVVVAATDSFGSRASFTNYGSLVDVSAPGGDMNYGGGGILSTGDSGTAAPSHDNLYQLKQGTSMAVPHVSGVLSLMFSVNPMLTPSTAKQVLRSTARVFPKNTSWDCTTSHCGAGIIDAAAAVNASFANNIPVQVNALASGDNSSRTLKATIQPSAEDLNKMIRLYIGAKVGNQWYLHANGSWIPWAGGALPVFNTLLATNGVMDLLVAQNVNVSGLIGTEIYVGYGVNDADLLDHRKYGLVYTIH